MIYTVIGIFDHTSEAQSAKSYLVSNGFSWESINLSTRAEMERLIYDQEESHEGIFSFFSHLFGSHKDEEKYSKLGQRGAIVTVHATNVEQAEIATRILEKYDPLDIHKQTESAKSPMVTKETDAD